MNGVWRILAARGLQHLICDRATKRERRRLAQREYRRRFDAGRFTVAVEVDDAVVEMLITTGWLVAGECTDRKKIAECTDRKMIAKALSAMVAEAAKR